MAFKDRVKGFLHRHELITGDPIARAEQDAIARDLAQRMTPPPGSAILQRDERALHERMDEEWIAQQEEIRMLQDASKIIHDILSQCSASRQPPVNGVSELSTAERQVRNARVWQRKIAAIADKCSILLKEMGRLEARRDRRGTAVRMTGYDLGSREANIHANAKAMARRLRRIAQDIYGIQRSYGKNNEKTVSSLYDAAKAVDGVIADATALYKLEREVEQLWETHITSLKAVAEKELETVRRLHEGKKYSPPKGPAAAA